MKKHVPSCPTNHHRRSAGAVTGFTDDKRLRTGCCWNKNKWLWCADQAPFLKIQYVFICFQSSCDNFKSTYTNIPTSINTSNHIQPLAMNVEWYGHEIHSDLTDDTCQLICISACKKNKINTHIYKSYKIKWLMENG